MTYTIEQLLEQAKQIPHHSRMFNNATGNVLMFDDKDGLVAELGPKRLWVFKGKEGELT